MKKILAIALFVLVAASISLSAAPKRKNVIDNGVFSINTKNLRIFRPGTADPVALRITPATINAKGEGWITAGFKAPYTVETKENRTIITSKSTNKCFNTEIKYVIVKDSPAMLVDMKFTAVKAFHSQRGSAPSIDLPVNLTKLTLPEREPITLENNKKQITYQLRTWALYADADPEKDALMLIIPSLDDYDFSGGGRITCGQYMRGHGWRPGMDLSHPDFVLTDLEKDDEITSRFIVVFTNGKADGAKLFQEAIKTFQPELEGDDDEE